MSAAMGGPGPTDVAPGEEIFNVKSIMKCSVLLLTWMVPQFSLLTNCFTNLKGQSVVYHQVIWSFKETRFQS